MASLFVIFGIQNRSENQPRFQTSKSAPRMPKCLDLGPSNLHFCFKNKYKNNIFENSTFSLRATFSTPKVTKTTSKRLRNGAKIEPKILKKRYENHLRFLITFLSIFDGFWPPFWSILAPFFIICAHLFPASILHRFVVDFSWFLACPNHHFILKNKAFRYFPSFSKQLNKS